MIFRNNLSKYLLASVSAGAMMLNTSAFANPDGAKVIVGDVDIAGIGTSHVIVDSNTSRAIVDWDNFSIGTGETTTINQVSSDAAILNRVTGGNVTEIFGTLESNGQVFLINESGILVGENGVVETNGVVLSTLDVSNSDFLGAGDMIFSQGIETGGGIEVHGKIRSISGGDIFILSREITIGETGQIDANGGYVGLGAGEEILLKPMDSGEGRISIRAGKGKIVNRGSVEGVAAELKAAGGNEYALAINNTGVVRAKGYSKKGGKIRLGGGGKVRNTGKLIARKKVVVRSAVKIENKGLVKAGNGDKGGEIVFEAPEIIVENGSLLDVSGALGGGRVFVGGGYQGSAYGHDGVAVDISENATNVVIERGSVISADATVSGDAGDVVVWSDDTTVFGGLVTAKATDGVGGDAEISGKRTLNLAGFAVDLVGSDGKGTLLLDPGGLTISNSTPSGTNNLHQGDIQTALGYANVTLLTSGASTLDTDNGDGDADNSSGVDESATNAGTGDIDFEAGVDIQWSADTTLFVHAGNDINALNNVIIQNSDSDMSDGTGGVVLLAAGSVNLGSAAATGAVAIGSEYGSTVVKAGVTNFATQTVGNTNKISNVNVTGGGTAGAFAQIGYTIDGTHSDVDAANGDILVEAAGNVIVTGGSDTDAADAGSVDGVFAQIGHGGYLTGHSIASEIVSSDITVRAGLHTAASKVELKGGKDGFANHAQIGHGVVRNESNLLVGQGNISGNVTVTSGYATDGTTVVSALSDVIINGTFVSEDAGQEEFERAKIGHGATLIYNGSGESGAEITHGKIDGNVVISAADDLIVGGNAAPGDAHDRYWMESQIGHGGYSVLNYDGTAVSGDKELRVIYGRIAAFDDAVANGSGGPTTHGTNVTIKAGTVILTATETPLNSAAYTADHADNMISNQIGHGSTTRYSSGASPAIPASSGEVLIGGTALPTAQATGAYDESVTTTNASSVGTGGASGVQVQNLTEAIINGLSASEAAALAVFMATDPADTDLVPATQNGVTYTELVNQSTSNVDLDAVIGALAGCGAGTCTVADLDGVDTSGLNAAQQAALGAFIAGAPKDTVATGVVNAVAAATVDDKLDIYVKESDISGDIFVYDTDTSDSSGIIMTAGITAGLNAVTNDRMTNRIGHATRNFIVAHDGNNSSDDAVGSNDAGKVTIRQANILGADILIDTVTQGTTITIDDANESHDQDIVLTTSIVAGLGKVERNEAFNIIGHGGEVLITTGNGGDTDPGNTLSGHGGDIEVIRGTIWDGAEHDDGGEDDVSYGGSVDVTLNSSNQIILDDDVSAALAKAESNNAISQIGSGTFLELYTGNGGTTANSGSGGRGGDILVTWNQNQQRDHHGDNAYDDYARGIMGAINLTAEHDGTLTGHAAVDKPGYALDITSDDKAALAKADHNTVIGQVGHGDFMELMTGDGGAGGDLNTSTTGVVIYKGQVNGGRGGDIKVLFNDNDSDRNDLSDMKIISDITVNVKGAIRGEAVITNALSPEKHGLVEATIGHGTRVFAIAGDGADGGATSATNSSIDQIVGFDPDITDGSGNEIASVSNGSVDSTLRGKNGEIIRGGAVGGDGGDVEIALGDITDRYTISDGSNTSYYYDGNYDLHVQRNNGTNVIVSGDSDADIEIWATHNEGATGVDLAKSVYFHAQVKHALSEGPGSEVNAQIGHQKRIQAQGGLAGDGGGNIYEQVDFSTLQADFSGGNGGDVDISNSIIVGDITIEAERQVQFFAEAGHGTETIVTALIGHNTHLAAITRAGGDGGDLYLGLGQTDNNVQEYWETTGSAPNDYHEDTPAEASGVYSITLDIDGNGDTTQNITIGDVFVDLGLVITDSIEDLAGVDLDGLSEFQLAALEAFVEERKKAGAPAAAAGPLFALTLQDLNKDDKFTLGDAGTSLLGTNADTPDDNGYHDDGIGIAVDGNDAIATDKEVATATHALLNGENGVDQDLDEGATKYYKTGINPNNTIDGDALIGAGSGTTVEAALMVYDHDGNPQYIAVNRTTESDVIYVANTQQNIDAIIGDGNLGIHNAFLGTAAFQSNADDNGSGSEAEFIYSKDLTGTNDIGTFDGTWDYNSNYDASNDASTDKFTYVDLNLDRQVDLVDFDADGKFDVVDIDQNAVYDRIDGRVGNTGVLNVSAAGHDNNGNANIIDYSSNTGMNYDASHTEGGWQVADLSHADGGRGGNATTSVDYIEGNIGVYTGNVNFAVNEAYDGDIDNPILSADRVAAATAVTDSLIVKTDVQDNIVDTGGIDDTVISRIGHGAYQYSDTAGESDDNKVGRTLFITDTDAHKAAEGGDAGMHALNASGGDGGDGESILGDTRTVALNSDGSVAATELDHLVGDIAINTRMSKTDSTIVWSGTANSGTGGWVSNGGFSFVADPMANGISGTADTVAEKITNESSANRVVVTSKVDNALSGNIGIAQIGHGAISIVDATAALGGDGESGNGSEIEAHQTEIANGGHGGAANSVAHHLKGVVTVMAGRAPDPADEITSIVLSAEEGPRIVPGSNGDIVVAQFGHGRIGYAGGGAGGESDDGQWQANGGDGGDAISIQRDILDSKIVVNSSDLFGHGMDVLATALQGSNHIVRAQIGQGDINFAESNAGGDAAPSKSSVVEQWNQSANGGRGGDAIALQAGYNYDITVDVGSAPDTKDADKASLRIVTDAQNIFLGTENHILANIGHGGYSHAESASAKGGKGSYRSALAGISTGDSETPFSTYVSLREGGRGGNAISEIGINGTGRMIDDRENKGAIIDHYLNNDLDGADISARTHDRSYDSDQWLGNESSFGFNLMGGTSGSLVDLYARYDGILVMSQAGPGVNHVRAIDTNTAQIGHSGFNRADAKAGKGISQSLMFGRVAPTNADGGHGIQSIFSANIQEGDGGNGGDAFAFTGAIDGDVLITNVVADEANDTDNTAGITSDKWNVIDGTISDEDGDTNIVFRATGGTVKADHRVDSRGGHFVASEAVTDSNGGNAARPPQPVISFIAAVSSHAGAAGDASSIQGALSGDIVVIAENSVIEEAKKTTLAADEGFFVGVGHRLENDLEALGQGGISGMIGAPGTVKQATFKDDGGQDNRDDATEIGSNKADEQHNLLATYRALYEVKLRMEGRWTQSGSTLAAVDFPTAYKALSAYEKTLVRPVLGDPTSTGEYDYRNINSENQDFYTTETTGNFDVVGRTRDNNNLSDLDDVSRTSGIIKTSTSSKDIAHRFGSLDRNEGYGSGKNMAGIASDGSNGIPTVLTVIFGQRDNDAATTGKATDQVLIATATDHDVNLVDVDEAIYGNIPTPSADEIEALRYVMAASGDGGNVRSIQGNLSGNITLTANAYDGVNTGLDLTQVNARGIYINSNDAALSPTDLFAVVGHGSELIKARAGDAGLHHDTAVQVTASVGGDGGDAIVKQYKITGDIVLNSAYVIDVQAENNGLGTAEEDTRIGHQLKVGSHLEDFATGITAAVVAGIGGQDAGLGGSTRNGSGGDVNIDQYGATGTILLTSTGDIADGEGLVEVDADGSVDEIAIRIFADNANISADHTEVHVGHDQNIDSAQAGDAGRMHALNTYEGNKGLIGVIEGKGGDVTVAQALLTSPDNDVTADVIEGITIAAKDVVFVKGFVNNGKNRNLIGHDTTAGKEWQDAELDHSEAGNKLVAGIGGDSFVELFDDVDGGEADSGTVRVKQGTNNKNGTADVTDDYYEALKGDITISSGFNEVIVYNLTGLGGDTFVEVGHQLKLSAETTEAGKQRGVTDQTAGDGGDILVTRGRITGDISLWTDGRANAGLVAEATTDTTDIETEADGRVLVDSLTGSGGTAEILLGHGSESILKTGRSGFSQEFEATNYDGADTPTAGAGEAGTLTVLAALQEIVAKTVPNSTSSDTATLTNVDKRDAIRLINNTVSALEMAQQYNDRLTVEEQQNLQNAVDEAIAAQSALGSVELETQAPSGLAAIGYYTTYQAVVQAAARAAGAIELAMNGEVLTTDLSSLNDLTGSPLGTSDMADYGLKDAGAVYAGVFGDHADGGDIRIDENDDLTAVNATNITGDISLTGNTDEGVVRVTSGGGLGSIAVTELGHRLEIKNSTGEGAGETDGAPPEGGEAGDGGNINIADFVTGDITITANRLVITTKGLEDSLTHFGHDLDTDNDTGMADIDSKGLGNGGNVNTAQTVSGNILLQANEVTAAIDDAVATAELTVAGLGSILDIGHMADQFSESDDDGRVAGPVNSVEYNRAGDMVSSQTIAGNVTIDLDLDRDGSDSDLIINASAYPSNAIDIMHDGANYAFSGKAGHGNDGDGQTVTVAQNISGNFNVSGLEDYKITSAGGGINIGHDGENTGHSGQINDAALGDDYGERVDADQNISGLINLTARRSVTIDVKADKVATHIGHTAIQTAMSADDGGDHDTEEGYRDVDNNLLIADVDADQTVSGGLSIVTGEILLKSTEVAGVHFGHEASHITMTDLPTGDQPGHIEANSSITGDMSLIADNTDDNSIGSNVGSNSAPQLDITVAGTITFDGAKGLLQFGHAADTTTGHAEDALVNGSVNTEQTVTSIITVSADDDLIMKSASGGEGHIGHSIVEMNSAMGTGTAKGHENSYLEADGTTRTASDASQRIVGNIIVDVDDYMEMNPGVGDLQIGHESEKNFAQIGVSDQMLIGDITVNVGTEANGTPDGLVTTKDDDAMIGVATGKTHVGHQITVTADNEVQIASGDIWFKVGADLHVTNAQIGHEGYDFADIAVVAATSYDLTVAKAAALGATTIPGADTDLGSGDGVGAIRNRIQGNTTIGSAQNSPSEDSTLQADVMKFDTALINSGYGGIGNKDVDGELRFFLPAQEGLTIVPDVTFNDSTSNEAALAARTASAGNVFTADGGLDHEHNFELMSDSAAYSDSVIGAGNFGFYFETPPATAAEREFYTPYITEAFGDNGFDLVYFDEDTGSKTAVNIDSLADDYIGTSSLEVACEEAGLSVEECNRIRENYVGQLTGVGSNTLFSGNAGGGQNLNIDLDDEFDPSLITINSENSYLVPNTVSSGYSELPSVVNEYGYVRPVTITKKNRSISSANVVVSNKVEYSKTTLNQTFDYKRLSQNGSVAGAIVSKNFTITTKARENGYSGTVVYGDSFDTSSSYEGSASYGQYVEAGAINAYQQETYPSALSFASSYIVFEDNKYN